MDKRRSERLRRKRQTSSGASPQPATSQPGVSQPGAYSVYNNSYVVESEASFLPPPQPAPGAGSASKPPLPTPSTPTPQSRRTRYKDSPHRYTIEDSPVPTEEIEPSSTVAPHSSSTPPPAEPMPPAAQNASTPRRRDGTDRVVDRVRTSLFDILGSATRRPVNPHWRPPPSLHPSAVSRPVSRLPHASQEAAGDILPSDDEGGLDDDEHDDGIARTSPLRLAPPRDPDRQESSLQRWRRVMRSPTKILAVCLLLSLVVLTSLEALTNARKVVFKPSIWDRVSGFATMGEMRTRATALREHTVCKSMMEAMATTKRVLLRNPWLMPQPQEGVRKDLGQETDMITRTQLESEILPRIIQAARSAASEEAERITQKITNDIQTLYSQTIQQQQINQAKQDKQGTNTDESAVIESFVEQYAADKNRPADFALASAGGAVISTKPSQLTIWGRYLRRYARALISEKAYTPTYPRNPSIILSPDILPGNCWAFDGSKGSVTIRVARPIVTQSITIEHTPAKSAFSTKAALHDFQVIGIPVGEEEEFKMGDFQFDFSGDSGDGGVGGKSHMQRFYVDATERIVVRAVRVEIGSNHGASYTAVYRIRVHGDEDVYLIPSVPGDEEFVTEE